MTGSTLAVLAPLAVQLHTAVDAVQSADVTAQQAQQAAEVTLQHQSTAQSAHDEHLVQVLRAQAADVQSLLEGTQVGREGVKLVCALLHCSDSML